MRENLSGYLEALYEQNPAAVGGSLPGEDFYWVQE
jgi:NitT/TauT family transport system substrate-binding protein